MYIKKLRLTSIKSNDLVKYYKNDTQYTASFYDSEGNQSETIVNTITIVEEDNNDSDFGFTFNDAFVNNLLEGIFNLLRRIFELIGGALA